MAEARLEHGDSVVATAAALGIRTQPMDVPAQAFDLPPDPAEGVSRDTSNDAYAGFHNAGVEHCFVRGMLGVPGVATDWIRLCAPVVPGEDPSPLQRVAAAADFGNGISGLDEMQRLLFINPDLTIHLHRLPVGEWVCLDAVSRYEPNGIGIAASDLYDEQRPDRPIDPVAAARPPLSPCTSSPPRATSTTASRRSSSRSPAWTPTGSRRRSVAASPSTSASRGRQLPSGTGIAFVDVPGHVRFLKNMLAGVGGVDACLFVVAATEGWKPQSEEHLRILELLGVEHGLVALTKVGLVDEDHAELARAGRWPTTGRHLPRRRRGRGGRRADGTSALETLRARARPAPGCDTRCRRPRPSPPVDRPRPSRAKGAGHRRHGDADRRHAAGRRRARRRARDGRAAGAGAGAADPSRWRTTRSAPATGSRSTSSASITATSAAATRSSAPAQWHRTATFDASLHVLGIARPRRVAPGRVRRVHRLAASTRVRLRILGPDALPAGGDGPRADCISRAALPLMPGDRYVLRESGRSETVGGGEVLDVDPVVRAARARPDRSVDRVVAERGWVDVGELERLTGERRAPTVGRWAVDPATFDAARTTVDARIADAGPLGLDVATLDERERPCWLCSSKPVASSSPEVAPCGPGARTRSPPIPS